MTKTPWKESNLALIGSDLDHKIKQAAAENEEQWQGLGESPGKKVWRIEKFQVKPWPEFQYGQFHKGDSYIVLNSYKKGDSDGLAHDIHIWIGSESSQDEYGTAAYKMVEADDFLGGAAIQHREIQSHESSVRKNSKVEQQRNPNHSSFSHNVLFYQLFQTYFSNLTYLEGGVESGFNHVEPTPEEPHLYRIKGTEKGLSLTQVPISKSSLNKGDSFILMQNKATVWLWNGESANPDEKAKANAVAESMCTEGTVTTLDQGHGDEEDEAFWTILGDGEIQEADDKDEEIEEFAPLLFKLCDDPEEEPIQVAKGEKVKFGFGRPTAKLPKDSLSESDVFLIDAGWEVFVWIGKDADRSEKLSAMAKADAYCKTDPRTADLPLTIVKSGWEPSSFNQFFV